MILRKTPFFLPVFLLFICSISYAQVKDTSFKFTLSADATTSAGVFRDDSILIRTLWNAVEYKAGDHIKRWDGLLDDGSPAAQGNYSIKILSSQVKYEWEGAVIGNTSSALTGNTKLRFFDPLFGMAVTNNTIYWAAGYNEGWPASFKTSINDPNTKTWIGPLKQTNQMSTFVCTDGSRVYWGGLDPIDPEHESFVYATKVSNDERVNFTYGVSATMNWGSTYSSVIAYHHTPRSVASLITGMAVQQNGRFLFVSRKGLNQVLVIDKFSGEIIQTLSINKAAAMQTDKNDNLWIAHENCTEKFKVETNGTLVTTNIKVPLINNGGMSVSPDNAVIIMADINTESVKAYSNNTGDYLWTLGSSISYTLDASVKNDKFYWKDVRMEYATFLCYMPDGSFYIGDQQNRRVQHYKPDRSFIDNIMFIPAFYATCVDPNNPSRVFADFLEFKVDYNKKLDRYNGSWELVKNWGANISDDYDLFEKLKQMTTFSNGHTYGRIRTKLGYAAVELVEGGAARFTGSSIPRFTSITDDGSLITITEPKQGESQIMRRYALSGFDAQHNPIWSNAGVILASTPALTKKDPLAWEAVRLNKGTPSEQVVFFNAAKSDAGSTDGYHLGAVKKNSGEWLWKAAKSTSLTYNGPFPVDGAFDNGNGVVYPGGTLLVHNKHIFWNYRGEFWKNSQTNKWNHVYENGLLVGQFGELTIDHKDVEAFGGGAGNVMSGSVVTVNGTTYLYHNDESVHGGVHRWKISGLNTIEVKKAIYPFQSVALPMEGIDLLQGLISGESLKDNLHGWKRTPANDFITADNRFSANIGSKSYDKFKCPDLLLSYAQNQGTASVTRDLGNNDGLTAWKLEGAILLDDNTPNEPKGNGGSYMEVLDKNNLVIARFFIERDLISGTNVIFNGKVIYNAPGNHIAVMNSKIQTLEISGDSGVLTFKYGKLKVHTTKSMAEAGADWQSPAVLRFHFFTKVAADNFSRSIDLIEMKFFKKTDTHFRSKKTGSWNNKDSWQISTDNINWKDAIRIPDTSANSIKIQSGHVITVSDQLLINKLHVLNGSTLVLSPTASIVVANGEGDDIVIHPGAQMIVKSDSTGSGTIAASSGTIKGTVTVEKFINSFQYKAYRLLAPSVNTSGSIKPSIRDNWQEGQNNINTVNNSNTLPGYGIHITGNNADKGFDADPSNNVSLQHFDQIATPQKWSAAENTNISLLEAKKGFMVYIRGDRSTDKNNPHSSSNTILRATGSILSGDQMYNILEKNGRNSLVTNPYVSPVDWSKIYNDPSTTNSQQFENYYTYWEPSIGSSGGYVTVTSTGIKSAIIKTTTIIPAGQAFFIKSRKAITPTTFVIKENHKTVKTSGTENTEQQQLITSLLYYDSSGKKIVADAVNAIFSNEYSNDIDMNDAEEIANPEENLALLREGKMLSIESRHPAKIEDTLELVLSNLQHRDYQWQFNAYKLSPFALKIFLEDKFLKSYTLIKSDSVSIFSFSVTADAASSDSKRFRIIFGEILLKPEQDSLQLNLSKTNSGVMLEWSFHSETVQGFEIERSTNGIHFEKIETIPVKMRNPYYYFDHQPLEGYNFYRIKILEPTTDISYSYVKKIIINTSIPEIKVYPNPILNDMFSISLSNLPKGTYLLKVINIMGQLVYRQSISIENSFSVHNISFAHQLPAGVYDLQIAGVNALYRQKLIK